MDAENLDQELNDQVYENEDEKITYYYSKFDLFDEKLNFSFIKYQIFKNNLEDALGQDWIKYASIMIYKIDQQTNQKIFEHYQNIFNEGLQVWLDLRKEINYQSSNQQDNKKQNKDIDVECYNLDIDSQKQSSQNDYSSIDTQNKNYTYFQQIQSKSHTNQSEQGYNLSGNSHHFDNKKENDIESILEENDIYQIFEQKILEKFNDSFVEPNISRPVLQGFYATAMQVWKKSIDDYYDIEQNMIQEDKEQQQEQQSNQDNQNNNFQFLRDKIKSFIPQQKIIKPIFIATEKIIDQTEKIYDYFKNKKKNQTLNYRKNSDNLQDLELSEAKNFNNYHSIAQKELSLTDELKIRMKNLSMQDDQLDEEVYNRKRKNNEITLDKDKKTKIVQIRKFTPKIQQKEIDPQHINFASDYIEKIMKNSIEKFQVVRGIVTNIIEVNYNMLNNIQNKINIQADQLKNQVKIRFFQPATDFYHHLMKIWIIIKVNNKNQDLSFNSYLEQVKISMGSKWNDKYVNPTQIFFETLFSEWNKIQYESYSEDSLKVFIQRVRSHLLLIWENWEDDLTKKMQFLHKKVIQPKKKVQISD